VQRWRWRLRLLASLVVMAFIVSAPGSAAAFGTIDSGGQRREHERVTRAALSCAGEAGSDPYCFEPGSIDYLAGHDHEFGAVGAPDSDELSDPAAHCDNADFLEGGYPRTRDQATASLVTCVNHMRTQFGEGVESAQGLLDDRGRVVAGAVNLQPPCRSRQDSEDRAKCLALEGLGRALHGTQDFYAHSNWADEADPTRPIGDDNPPGLNQPGPSAVLDLRATTTPSVPAELTTGCYVLKDEVPGVGECAQRVTHAAINKDRGLIDPDTGKTADPTTPRGMVEDNFAKAVSGAIIESRRQWTDFQSELTARYGKDKGERMICALTHDDPANDCRGREWTGVVVLLLVVGIALAAIATVLVLRRRRRRPSEPESS
jgi:hypothetical protein